MVIWPDRHVKVHQAPSVQPLQQAGVAVPHPHAPRPAGLLAAAQLLGAQLPVLCLTCMEATQKQGWPDQVTAMGNSFRGAPASSTCSIQCARQPAGKHIDMVVLAVC